MHRIPTLDELFEMLGSVPLYNVELKGRIWPDDEFLCAVRDRVQAHRLPGRVLISSFSPFMVRRSRKVFDDATAVALLLQRGWQRVAAWLAHGDAEHPHHSLIDETYMRRAAARKQRVHAWTVDDPSEARRLARLGVNGIITNRPMAIREALHDHVRGQGTRSH
jgi:glycerophosphoryl diester phosphodiesterase